MHEENEPYSRKKCHLKVIKHLFLTVKDTICLSLLQFHVHRYFEVPRWFSLDLHHVWTLSCIVIQTASRSQSGVVYQPRRRTICSFSSCQQSDLKINQINFSKTCKSEILRKITPDTRIMFWIAHTASIHEI